MLAVLFIAGMILSGSLAYAGLVRGKLQLSKETTLTGPTAKTLGIVCLTIMLALLAATIWAVWTVVTGK